MTGQTTIGCDLGDRWSEVCVLAADGTVQERARVRTTPEGVRKFYEGRNAARVVIEVGTHSPWVARLLKELGHEALVANPRRVRLVYASRTKHDRLDAEALARLGRIDPSLLSPVIHRGPSTRADLAIIRARDELVQVRSKLVNHVRGVVKSSGSRLPPCEAESFHRRVRELIPATLREALTPVLDVLQHLAEQIHRCERLIEERAERTYPETSRLTQVPGVGALTALSFVLTLESPDRFPRSRTVGAFLGLARRQYQSGERDPALGITKHGDRYLRRLLVSCAHRILGPFGKDCDLRRWGLAMAARGGRSGKRRAVVAVARKLAVLLHRLRVSGEPFVAIGYAR
jgi:transposase